MWHVFKLSSVLLLLMFIYMVVQRDSSLEKYSHAVAPRGHKPDLCSSEWLKPVIKGDRLK